jgi:hypothetical protein
MKLTLFYLKLDRSRPTRRKTFARFALTLAGIIGASVGAEATPASFIGTPYTQNFDSMGPTGTTTPVGWFVGSGTGAAVTGTTVTASTGSIAAQGNYNFGVAGVNPVTDRALGSIGGGNVQTDTDLDIMNNSTFAITQFTISYTGEEWRNGGSTIANTLTLQLSLNGSTWVNLGAIFNFTSPINTGGGGSPLDGNLAANRAAAGGTYTLTSGSIPIGSTFYLRFADPDDPKPDSGIAVDDFTFSAMPAPEPSAYMLLGVGLLLCGQRFLRRKAV